MKRVVAALALAFIIAGAAVGRPAPILAVSILAADQAALGDAVSAAERGGASAVHVDVMDGHFVPNLAYGPETVKAVRAHTHLSIDVHLMVAEPDTLLPLFAQADNITVHAEACHDLVATLKHVHDLRTSISAGVALNPETPVSSIEYAVPYADRVMLMSVHPGFGGQHFIPDSVARLDELKALLKRLHRDIPVEMDGGIGPDNVSLLVQHGLDIAVSGSAVFGQPDVTAATRHMVEAMQVISPSPGL